MGGDNLKYSVVSKMSRLITCRVCLVYSWHYFGHVKRREKLEDVMTTERIRGKRDRKTARQEPCQPFVIARRGIATLNDLICCCGEP